MSKVEDMSSDDWEVAMDAMDEWDRKHNWFIRLFSRRHPRMPKSLAAQTWVQHESTRTRPTFGHHLRDEARCSVCTADSVGALW